MLDGYTTRDVVVFYDLEEGTEDVKSLEFRVSTLDELDNMLKYMKVWNKDFRYLGHLFLQAV